MTKKEGILFYNSYNRRMGISYKNSTDDGLHCGKTLDVKLNDVWVPTRIEMSGDAWYLVGLKGLELEGLTVRA